MPKFEDDILTIRALRPKNGETEVLISYENGFMLYLKKDQKIREEFLNYIFKYLNKFIDEVEDG